MKKCCGLFFTALFSLTASVAHAVNNVNYPCPTTFAYVATGYSVEQVIAICGLPTQRTTTKQQPNAPRVMEEWSYSKNPYLANRPVASLGKLTTGYQQLLIILYNNKVVGISANGRVTNTTNYCRGIIIQQGDSSQQVISACGVAQRVTQVPANITPVEVTKLIYQRPNYLPSTIFVFENNKLVEKIN